MEKKSAKLKVLHGTDQPCRRKVVPKIQKDNMPLRLPAPEYLGKYGKKKWNELVKILRDKKILERADLGALEGCCLAYDEMVQCSLAIEEAGGIVLYSAGKRQIPLITVRAKAMETYRKYISEFGLSPAARAKQGIESAAKEDDLQKFIKTFTK